MFSKTYGSLTRIFLVVCCLSVSWFFFPASALCVEEEKPVAQLSPTRALSLIEIYTWSNTLPRELIDLQNNIDTIANVASIEDKIPDIEQRIEELEWDATMAKSNPNLSFDDLENLESTLSKINAEINAINKPIETNVQDLETWYREWLDKESKLKEISQQAAQDAYLQDSLPTITSLAEVIATAKKLIENQIRPNLLAGREIGGFQTRVYTITDIIGDLVKERKMLRMQQTAPSMLSADFYGTITKQRVFEAWQNLRLFAHYQVKQLKQQLYPIGISLFGLLVVALFVGFSKSLVIASHRWYPFASRPMTTAIFMFCTTLNIINILAIPIHVPENWELLIRLPLIISVALLSDLIFKVTWQNTLLKQLLVFLAIILFFAAINLPQPLYYLFVFYSSLLLFVYYLYFTIRRLLTSPGQKITWSIMLWAVFPLTILISGVGGYDQLASVIFGRVLSLILASLIIWLMSLFAAGIIELFLCYFPLKLVRQNAALIIKQLLPILILAHAIFWLTAILTIMLVYPTVNAAFEAITSLQFSFFSMIITPGSVLGIIFIGYATLLCSRGVRAFMCQEVLPRYNVDPGVQISIARLVHYAILTVGLIILLRVLGFGLSQVTILGGALGIGIGFGLQAIVNNFVSGLILLFERPIKVGDMIAVGEELGEVKELGLRATTVQTFDNAEIVIPNSELVTGSVTNWTLAEKRIRVKVPVGVAYGSDIEKVLKILLSCAEANPTVLSTPKPQALFLAFGSSSLDFQVRVWIADFADRLDVLSELNQDIENEFQLAGIEIPFPQTDLHVRSVDDGITALINKNSGETGS